MISIIIPTLNEEENLPGTLAAIRKLSGRIQVIVVDAGSTDGTVKLAESEGVQVITSDQRQRAHQLNLGAAVALGEILWFVHADTLVDPMAAQAIRRALTESTVVGGGFRRRFRSASPWLFLSCKIASLRSRWAGLYFGDQSLYVRRNVFARLGGFSDLPVFEDFDFCRRLRPLGKMRCLGPPVWSSARRFQERGALVVLAHDLWLTWLYHRGESPYKIWERLHS